MTTKTLTQPPTKSTLENDPRTPEDAAPCCTSTEQQSCCDASAKAGCCGPASTTSKPPSKCGCR